MRIYEKALLTLGALALMNMATAQIKPSIHKIGLDEEPIINIDSAYASKTDKASIDMYIFRGEGSTDPNDKITPLEKRLLESSPEVNIHSFEFEDTRGVDFRFVKVVSNNDTMRTKITPPRIYIKSKDKELMQSITNRFNDFPPCMVRYFEKQDAYGLVLTESSTDFFNQINNIIKYVNNITNSGPSIYKIGLGKKPTINIDSISTNKKDKAPIDMYIIMMGDTDFEGKKSTTKENLTGYSKKIKIQSYELEEKGYYREVKVISNRDTIPVLAGYVPLIYIKSKDKELMGSIMKKFDINYSEKGLIYSEKMDAYGFFSSTSRVDVFNRINNIISYVNSLDNTK